jgi:hypothetical protein
VYNTPWVYGTINLYDRMRSDIGTYAYEKH